MGSPAKSDRTTAFDTSYREYRPPPLVRDDADEVQVKTGPSGNLTEIPPGVGHKTEGCDEVTPLVLQAWLQCPRFGKEHRLGAALVYDIYSALDPAVTRAPP